MAGNAGTIPDEPSTASPTPTPEGYSEVTKDVLTVEANITFPVDSSTVQGGSGYALRSAMKTGLTLALGYLSTDENVAIISVLDQRYPLASRIKWDAKRRRLTEDNTAVFTNAPSPAPTASPTPRPSTLVTFEVVSSDAHWFSLTTLENNIRLAGHSGAIIANVQAEAMRNGVLSEELLSMDKEIEVKTKQMSKTVIVSSFFNETALPDPITSSDTVFKASYVVLLLFGIAAIGVCVWYVLMKKTAIRNAVKPNAAVDAVKSATKINQIAPGTPRKAVGGAESNNVQAESSSSDDDARVDRVIEEEIQRYSRAERLGDGHLQVEDFKEEEKEEIESTAPLPEDISSEVAPPPEATASAPSDTNTATEIAASGSLQESDSSTRMSSKRASAALVIQRAWRNIRWHFRLARLLEQRKLDPKQTEFCKRIVRAMVAKHAPQKLKNMDELFTLYKGLDDLRSLVRRVASKYGLDGNALLRGNKQALKPLAHFIDAQPTLKTAQTKGPPVAGKVVRTNRMPTVHDLAKSSKGPRVHDVAKSSKGPVRKAAKKPKKTVQKGTGQSAMKVLRRGSADFANSIMAQMKSARRGPPANALGPSRTAAKTSKSTAGPSHRDVVAGTKTKSGKRNVVRPGKKTINADHRKKIDSEIEQFRAALVQRGKGEKLDSEKGKGNRNRVVDVKTARVSV
jgi:hypothetical protein